MNKKDINEIKRRFTKDGCNFSRITGCYIGAEKEIITTFSKTFLNLDDSEFFKYLEIAKKAMSGKLKDNLLELEFIEPDSNRSLIALRDSSLMNEEMLTSFYQNIIEAYDHVGNYLILLFHDAYDVPVKTTDNGKLDESEEVYEYIICAICPVELTDAALGYLQEENEIGSQTRNWIVKQVESAFTFPCFTDRQTDLNAVLFYTKDTKNPHIELIENILKLKPITTATQKKDSFNHIISAAYGQDIEDDTEVYFEIEKSFAELVPDDPSEKAVIKSEDVKNVLKNATSISDDKIEKASDDFNKYFTEEIELEDIIDEKFLKKSDLLEKIKTLKEQVAVLTKENERLKQRLGE